MNTSPDFMPLAPLSADFVPLGFGRVERTRESRTDARSGYRVFAAADGFEVAIPESVLERLAQFARSSAPMEWYGLVIGRELEDEVGPHTVVAGVVPDTDVKAGPASIESSPSSEFRTRTSARALYPDAGIIGWAHTHPRMGVFFSGTDRANQATWTNPNSLGIVVDPWCAEGVKVFRGPKSELMTGLPRSTSIALERGEQDVPKVVIRENANEPQAITSASLPCSRPKRTGSRLFRAIITALGGFAVAGLVALAGVGVWQRVRNFEHRLQELESRTHVPADPGPRTPEHQTADGSDPPAEQTDCLLPD